MSDTTNGTPPRSVPASVPPGYAGGTPLMIQYFATRLEHPGAVLLMRVGDFFEAYGDDAELLARELNITLTGREDGGLRIPMAGVPHHAMERYVARLIARGMRIAIMDQVEDPKLAKGLVKRRVTRVVTPGTVLVDNMLDSRSNNYLVAAVVGGAYLRRKNRSHLVRSPLRDQTQEISTPPMPCAHISVQTVLVNFR